MKKISFVHLSLLTIVAVTTISVPASATVQNSFHSESGDLSTFFTSANSFFSQHVAEGKVDYAAAKPDYTALQNLTELIATADLSAADKNTKTAFYINAYNILVIKAVVDKMPVNSPLDVPGFFESRKHQIAGESLTLNEIENKKLRPDPRVHFALVCAAIGCPKILDEAYMPETVQAQLNTQTKKSVNDPAFIKINDDAQTVQISEIFEWYKDDFVKSSGSLLAFINKYRSTEIPATYSVTTYEYDWKLNKK